MPILLLLQSGSTAKYLQFVDETGLNPLPAGVKVSIYGGTTQTETSLVLQTYIYAGGFVNNQTLQPGGTYTASFSGTQAPSETIQTPFFYNSTGLTIATVSGYRSPCLSNAGYANEMTFVLPTGPAWFSDAAKSPGGTAYATCYGIAGQIAAVDAEAQTELGRMRLQTCQGADIDSWAADFLGSYFVRPSTSVSDSIWYSLITTCLQTEKCTISGIQAIVTAWLPYIISQFATPNPLTLDNSGSLDSGGGFLDTTATSIVAGLPTVEVFDLQSNPTLAAVIGLTLGEFCVYFRFPGYTDANIQRIRPFGPLLTKIVGLWKSAATVPVYAAATYSGYGGQGV